jgi:hypothetical protein
MQSLERYKIQSWERFNKLHECIREYVVETMVKENLNIGEVFEIADKAWEILKKEFNKEVQYSEEYSNIGSGGTDVHREVCRESWFDFVNEQCPEIDRKYYWTIIGIIEQEHPLELLETGMRIFGS